MDIVISNIETNECKLRVPACDIRADGTIWKQGMPLLVVGHLPNADQLKKKYATALKQKKFDKIDADHFARLGGYGGLLQVENAADYDERMRPIREAEYKRQQEIEARTIRVHLSSRGWGDYSPVEWTGDRETATAEIVAACQTLLANGHDVDQPNQADDEIAAKVEAAKAKSLERDAARKAKAAHDEQIEAKRQELIDAGTRLATPKQLAVIDGAREDWFNLFDGCGSYGMHGPSDDELRLMTIEEASRLVGQVIDARKALRSEGGY